MKIVLVRHGKAESPCANDAERALTLKGRQQARQTAKWLHKKIDADAAVCLLSSPYRRAQETAGIISEALHQPLRLLPEITPDMDARTALAAIARSADDADWVIVVSHMPLIAALAAWMEEAVLTSSSSFKLAEARILKAELLGPGTAVARSHFVPDVSD